MTRRRAALTVHESRDALFFVNGCQCGQVVRVELHSLQVVLNSLWRDRLGQDDVANADLVTDEDGAFSDAMLLCKLLNAIFLEQWATSAAQWGVCLDQDALLFTEVGNLLLWEVRVVFDLVGGRCNLGFL